MSARITLSRRKLWSRCAPTGRWFFSTMSRMSVFRQVELPALYHAVRRSCHGGSSDPHFAQRRDAAHRTGLTHESPTNPRQCCGEHREHRCRRRRNGRGRPRRSPPGSLEPRSRERRSARDGRSRGRRGALRVRRRPPCVPRDRRRAGPTRHGPLALRRHPMEHVRPQHLAAGLLAAVGSRVLVRRHRRGNRPGRAGAQRAAGGHLGDDPQPAPGAVDRSLAHPGRAARTRAVDVRGHRRRGGARSGGHRRERVHVGRSDGHLHLPGDGVVVPALRRLGAPHRCTRCDAGGGSGDDDPRTLAGAPADGDRDRCLGAAGPQALDRGGRRGWLRRAARSGVGVVHTVGARRGVGRSERHQHPRHRGRAPRRTGGTRRLVHRPGLVPAGRIVGHGRHRRRRRARRALVAPRPHRPTLGGRVDRTHRSARHDVGDVHGRPRARRPADLRPIRRCRRMAARGDRCGDRRALAARSAARPRAAARGAAPARGGDRVRDLRPRRRVAPRRSARRRRRAADDGAGTPPLHRRRRRRPGPPDHRDHHGRARCAGHGRSAPPRTSRRRRRRSPAEWDRTSRSRGHCHGDRDRPGLVGGSGARRPGPRPEHLGDRRRRRPDRRDRARR